MSDLDRLIKETMCETLEDVGNKLNSLYDDILAELEVKFTNPPDLPTDEQRGYMAGIAYSQDVNRKFMNKMVDMFEKKFLHPPTSGNELGRNGGTAEE